MWCNVSILKVSILWCNVMSCVCSRPLPHSVSMVFCHGNWNVEKVCVPYRGFNDHQNEAYITEHLPSCFLEVFLQQLCSSWSDNVAFWQVVLSYTGSGSGHIICGTNPGHSTSYRMELESALAAAMSVHLGCSKGSWATNGVPWLESFNFVLCNANLVCEMCELLLMVQFSSRVVRNGPVARKVSCKPRQTVYHWCQL